MRNKKSWMLGVGLAVALAGTSAVVAAEAATAYIGKEKAKQIALTEAPGKVTDVDLERKRSVTYYEVEIDRQDSGREVDVHVEAVTGKVLKVENDADDDRKIAAEATTATAATGNGTDTASKSATSAKSITKEQAVTLAGQAVKGEVLSVETDWDDGDKEYEVTLKTASGFAEVEISASTGKVLDIDYDDDDDYDDDHDDDDRD
ncbi:PepSY domain-containing protein [Paenibacillus brevis]|uniref:PepSY domain-containing protein n=1 Tax=Paenibacillus brevis TaxID=2841508 RepID=A0ABS6FPT3_9BACL|nr:PepSY domain-containing protein [Paenibacillus brevis]MBU5672230.1 PepSY domain-containing protein [Paenibacillus brevis]